MDMLIVSHFISDTSGNSNDRFCYLAALLCKYNKIELITSDFNHATKKKLEIHRDECVYKITAVHEPGYKKNVSVKRLISHVIMGRNLEKYLKERETPDLIYCASPSLSVAKVAAKYAQRNKIKFVVDIQDIWPEVFRMAFHVPVMSNIIFRPMEKWADYIYGTADKIVAVSDTYRKRGLRVNKKDPCGLTVFLGTDFNILFDSLRKAETKNNIELKKRGDFWLGYIGTLGSSYDILTAMKAVKNIQDKYIGLKLIILGDGPKTEEFKSYALKNEINVEFLGRRPYYEAMAILNQCDIALNPLVKGAMQSIINKVGDYAALGLPIVNSLENKEYRDLLEQYNAGINVPCEDFVEMAKAICRLIENKTEREQMGKNSRKLGDDRFDRSKTYVKIVKVIYEVLHYDKS